ncbi:MAG TPA: transglycosylase SLT domain-containing protein [Candidatus Binatia bacterium]|nr:transglycosylase SLT domain-containing protein [Candidatus Binatia bacterium]
MRLDVAYSAAITRAAQRWGIEPRLLAAVAAQETGGPESNSGRNIVGDGGHGHGLFQIDDRYHAFGTTADAMDPAKNADYAAHLLHDLLARNGGNIHAALSAYNAGSPNARGTLTTWSDGKTLDYADSVERHYAQLGGESPGAEPARLDPFHDAANIGALARFAGSFIPPSQPPAQELMSPSLQQMQRTDADGAGLIDAIFDDED